MSHLLLMLFVFGMLGTVNELAWSAPPAPRGERRLLYVSDPSSIATNLFPDPVRFEDLRRRVDLLAGSGVDMFNQEIYNQCWTTTMVESAGLSVLTRNGCYASFPRENCTR